MLSNFSWLMRVPARLVAAATALSSECHSLATSAWIVSLKSSAASDTP